MKKFYRRGYREEWKLFFLREYGPHPHCQICDSSLSWKTGAKNAVAFDHRHGEETCVAPTPSKWIYARPPTEENVDTWRHERFGLLCKRCNGLLPTSLKRRNAIAKYIEESGNE